MPDLHPTAASGFDAAAGIYDRYRPDYPPEAVELLVRELTLGPDARVLDLGAGTGKLTRHLVATGAQVLALEPVERMRDLLAAALPQVGVVDGTAEAIALPDGEVDAVTAAQAFHWFDAAAALADIRRVLRPGGGLGVLYNERDLDTPLQAAIDDLLAVHRGATPSWADQTWQRELDEPAGFAPPRRVSVPNSQRVDLDGLLGRVSSVSFVATLSDGQRQQLAASLGELFDAHQVDGEVVLAYRTKLWVAQRLP